MVRVADMAEGKPSRPDLAAALDAIYSYATDPDNFEEMTELLAQLVDEVEDPSLHELAQGLRAHLCRAESLAHRLQQTPPADEVSTSYCYMVVGRDMRIREISDALANELLPFCENPVAGARLIFTDPENATRYRHLAAEVMGAKGEDKSSPTLLRLASLEGEDALFGYLIAGKKLPELLQRRLGLKLDDPVTSLVFIAPEREVMQDVARIYQDAFGLTPAEARLAASLREGLSLKEASAEIGISLNTARNQIRSIFEKLGVNRQSDLIRHLTELSQLASYINLDAEGSFPPIGPADNPHDVPRILYTLPDGRKLCYREYGSVRGTCVLMLRSALNSSLVRKDELKVIKELGVRLICVERPGTGLSDEDPALSFESFARDVTHLLSHLGVHNFYLAANASASWFGLALAAHLGPRVRRLLLTTPRLSSSVPGVGRGSMTDYFFGHLRNYPWLLESTLFILRAKMSRPFLRSLAFHFFEKSPADYALLERKPELLEDLLDSTIESISAGYRGLMQEGELIMNGPYPDVSAIVAPISIWYGEQDHTVPSALILANLERFGIRTTDVVAFPELGHYLFENRHREFFEYLMR